MSLFVVKSENQRSKSLRSLIWGSHNPYIMLTSGHGRVSYTSGSWALESIRNYFNIIHRHVRITLCCSTAFFLLSKCLESILKWLANQGRKGRSWSIYQGFILRDTIYFLILIFIFWIRRNHLTWHYWHKRKKHLWELIAEKWLKLVRI